MKAGRKQHYLVIAAAFFHYQSTKKKLHLGKNCTHSIVSLKIKQCKMQGVKRREAKRENVLDFSKRRGVNGIVW